MNNSWTESPPGIIISADQWNYTYCSLNCLKIDFKFQFVNKEWYQYLHSHISFRFRAWSRSMRTRTVEKWTFPMIVRSVYMSHYIVIYLPFTVTPLGRYKYLFMNTIIRFLTLKCRLYVIFLFACVSVQILFLLVMYHYLSPLSTSIHTILFTPFTSSHNQNWSLTHPTFQFKFPRLSAV